MNILPVVMCLLTILSCGVFFIFEKSVGSHRIGSSWVGHIRANRNLVQKYEKALYNNCKGKSTEVPTPPRPSSTRSSSPKKKRSRPSLACAKLNIAPLIGPDREEYPLLYELTAKLFKTFYGVEKPFFDTFLQIAKEQADLAPEKFDFHNADFQESYYLLLKGSKKNLYPPLLDCIAIEPQVEKPLCLFHASPQLIALFFGNQAADKIYEEMHHKDALPITREVIERLCLEARTPIYNPEIFDLLQLGKNHKLAGKQTLMGKDQGTQITLRKSVYVPETAG